MRTISNHHVTMRKMFLFVVCSIAVLTSTCSEAALSMEVSPRYLDLDLTEVLTVNCSFSYDSVSNMSHLQSLTLSEKNDNQNNGTSGFEDMAAMFAGRPSTIRIFNPGQARHFLTGFNAKGISYLGLQWTSPSANVTGVYQCAADVVDEFGQPENFSETSLLTAESLDGGQLLETLHNQKNQMDTIFKTLSLMNDLINKLTAIEYLLNNLTIYVKTSIDSIDTRLNALEH